MVIMSVINQMLRELHHRKRSGTIQRDRLFPTSTLFLPQKTKRLMSWQLGIGALCLFVVSLALSWPMITQSSRDLDNPQKRKLPSKVVSSTGEKQQTISDVTMAFTLPQPIRHQDYLRLEITPASVQSVDANQQALPEVAVFEEETQVPPSALTATQSEQIESTPQADKKYLVIEKTKLSTKQELALLQKQLTSFPGHAPEKISILERILQLDPELHRQRIQLANLWRAQGKTEQARLLLQQGLQKNPDNLAIRLELADVTFSLQLFHEAYALLTTVEIKQQSTPVYFYALRALLAMRLGHPEDAREMYQSLITLEPKQSRWWFGLAIAKEQLDLNGEALVAYRVAQDLGVDHGPMKMIVNQKIQALEGRP